MAYKEREYRNWTKAGGLVAFEVVEKETDLAIHALGDLSSQARSAILTCREELEEYISRYPSFRSSLSPIEIDPKACDIVTSMARAASKAGVGPMAAVAGAVAEYVGRHLSAFSDEVIVENGGDIFMKTAKKRTVGIYAGESSPFTGKLALAIDPVERGIGICTSSGTVSHSLSFGSSDAVIILSEDTALADAAATATGNVLKSAADIEKSIEFARSIAGITGVIAIVGDKMASWGDVVFV